MTTHPRCAAHSISLAAGLLALSLAAGCSNTRSSLDPAPGLEPLADLKPLNEIDPSQAALIPFFERDPDRSFVVVGRVRASADARFEGMVDQARDDAGRALRAQAARAGAHAVIVDEAVVVAIDGGAIEQDPIGDLRSGPDRQRPGGLAYATRPVHRVVLAGRAIRWAAVIDRSPPAPTP